MGVVVSLRSRFRVGMAVLLDGKPASIAAFSPGDNYVHVHAQGSNSNTAMNEIEARQRLLVPGEDPKLVTLTDRERLLLEQFKSSGGLYLKGSDVRTARRLEKSGLVKLDDNGERYFAKVIAK